MLILCNIVASAKCVFLDIDENLVFKICNMKFCGATKTDVSVFTVLKSKHAIFGI